MTLLIFSLARKYERKKGARKYVDYSEESLKDAIKSVKLRKMSAKKAANHFNIPLRTLQRRVSWYFLFTVGL
jgi:hypothetical protein